MRRSTLDRPCGCGCECDKGGWIAKRDNALTCGSRCRLILHRIRRRAEYPRVQRRQRHALAFHNTHLPRSVPRPWTVRKALGRFVTDGRPGNLRRVRQRHGALWGLATRRVLTGPRSRPESSSPKRRTRSGDNPLRNGKSGKVCHTPTLHPLPPPGRTRARRELLTAEDRRRLAFGEGDKSHPHAGGTRGTLDGPAGCRDRDPDGNHPGRQAGLADRSEGRGAPDQGRWLTRRG